LKARLAELEMMGPRIVVPGHGDPGGVEIFRSNSEYIDELFPENR